MKNKGLARTTLQVRGRSVIGDGLKPYIIAEIGTNHNRSLEMAKVLLRGVADAGCDCAKFQIYEPDEIVSARVRASDYGLDSVYGDISAQDMFERYLKTPKEWFPELRDLCHELGMDFAATIHGEHGLNWANEIGLDLVKIASMDHTNLPFLSNLVNKLNVPILSSLGMAGLEDVEALFATIKNHQPGVGFFHCTAIYPPAPNELRLSNISYLVQKLGIPIGFSDHAEGVEAALDARGLGAIFFEKHVTTDKNQSGPDHPFAMEMSELKAYVELLIERSATEILEAVEFLEPSERELQNKRKFVKSIVTRRSLPVGHFLTAKDIYLARPGSGIRPADLPRVIGKALRHSIAEEMPLQWADLKADP
jgi:sialic acid synthase SpsE